MTQNPPIKYGKGRTYSSEEFELLNSWLKTHELVIEGTTISHFELGLLVDPVTKNIFTFKRDRCGVVRCRNCGWRDISGGDFFA